MEFTFPWPTTNGEWMTFGSALHGKPIVVVGRGWEKVLRTLLEELHTVESDFQSLTFVPDADSAVEALARALSSD